MCIRDSLDDNGISFPFSNTTANSQKIFVRVMSNKTECFNSDSSFNAVVATLTIIKNSSILVVQCDDVENND